MAGVSVVVEGADVAADEAEAGDEAEEAAEVETIEAESTDAVEETVPVLSQKNDIPVSRCAPKVDKVAQPWRFPGPYPLDEVRGAPSVGSASCPHQTAFRQRVQPDRGKGFVCAGRDRPLVEQKLDAGDLLRGGPTAKVMIAALVVHGARVRLFVCCWPCERLPPRNAAPDGEAAIRRPETPAILCSRPPSRVVTITWESAQRIVLR